MLPCRKMLLIEPQLKSLKIWGPFLTFDMTTVNFPSREKCNNIVKCKSSLFLNMKPWMFTEGSKVRSLVLLTSAVDGDYWSASRFGHLHHWRTARYMGGGAGWALELFWVCGEERNPSRYSNFVCSMAQHCSLLTELHHEDARLAFWQIFVLSL
jgi:hypothetical protein